MITGKLKGARQIEIPTLYNIGWNLRVLDREDLYEFSQYHQIRLLYTPLGDAQPKLCISLSANKLLLVNTNLVEPEILYHAWYGCFGLLGHDEQDAHLVGMCAVLPRSVLKYRMLKKQGIPAHMIGQRLWLAERYGL